MRELLERGVPSSLVEDGEAAVLLPKGGLFLVGADTLYQDGALVHKVGTRPLAERARRAGTKVVVVAPTSKILSRRPPARRTRSRGTGAELFDRTPGRFVDEVWTERGVWRPRRGPLPWPV